MPNQILEIHTASASKTLIEEPSHLQLIMVLPSNLLAPYLPAVSQEAAMSTETSTLQT
jgi:hypothetical protein